MQKVTNWALSFKMPFVSTDVEDFKKKKEITISLEFRQDYVHNLLSPRDQNISRIRYRVMP
jgi:hypothetical protein